MAWDAPEHYGVARKRVDARDPQPGQPSTPNGPCPAPWPRGRRRRLRAAGALLQRRVLAGVRRARVAMCAVRGAGGYPGLRLRPLRRGPHRDLRPIGTQGGHASATSPTGSCLVIAGRSGPRAPCRGRVRASRRRRRDQAPPWWIDYNRRREQHAQGAGGAFGRRRRHGFRTARASRTAISRASSPRTRRPSGSAGRSDACCTSASSTAASSTAASWARPSASSSRAGTPPAREVPSSGWSSRSTPAMSTWPRSPPPHPTSCATTSCGASGPRSPDGAA